MCDGGSKTNIYIYLGTQTECTDQQWKSRTEQLQMVMNSRNQAFVHVNIACLAAND
jgi:hypothetical protein